MALPAVLAKLIEAGASKLSEVATSKLQAVEEFAGSDNITLSDVQDLAEEFDNGTADPEARKIRTASPAADPGSPRKRIVGDDILITGKVPNDPAKDPAPDQSDPASDPADAPEDRATQPADPKATQDDRAAAPETRTSNPAPETEAPAKPEEKAGPGPEARAAASGPETEAPETTPEREIPSEITNASDAFEVGLRPHRDEFDGAVKKLSRSIEEELDDDPSLLGVLEATLKQSTLDVAAGSHDFLFGSIEGVAKVGENTARRSEEGNVLLGVLEDGLNASSVFPVGKAGSATVSGGKAALNGMRKTLGLARKTERTAMVADDAARTALRTPGPAKPSAAPRKPAANTPAKPQPVLPKSRRLPQITTPAQRKAIKRLLGRSFDSGFKKAWEKAVERSPAAREQLRRAKALWAQGKHAQARKLARKAYNNVRGKFWQEVRKNPRLSKAITDTGMKLPKTTAKGKLKQSAPYYETPAGKQKLTLEHTTRVFDDPGRAIDANNFVFSLGYENSVMLEAIRALHERLIRLGQMAPFD